MAGSLSMGGGLGQMVGKHGAFWVLDQDRAHLRQLSANVGMSMLLLLCRGMARQLCILLLSMDAALTALADQFPANGS